MASTTSTDERRVAGFELESVLGQGPRGTVYVATQTGLGRRVALKLYPPSSEGGGRHDFGGWPEHAGVARLHAAGTSEHGSFTASQLAPGGSLAARLAAGDIAREEALALCDEAAATLAAAGVAHGALGPGNVLIDAGGRALLCDFGMAGVDASVAADRRALAELRARCERLPPRVARRPRRPRRAAVFAFVAVAVVVAGAAFAATAGDDRPRAARIAAPPPLPGTEVLGSTLAGGAATTLGCDGRAPNGSAPACTIVPVARDGRPLTLRAGGVIRRWTVGGARGEMHLQVIREVRPGAYVVVASAQPERVTGTAAPAFATDLAVRRGDVVALALRPGAGVGIARGAGAATSWRFDGMLNYHPPRRPARTAGTALDGGAQLRVEVVPGGRPRPVPALAGAAARAAPAGRVVATREKEFARLRVRTVVVVALPGEVAIDVFRETTRLRRLRWSAPTPAGRCRCSSPSSFRSPGCSSPGATPTAGRSSTTTAPRPIA